MAVQDLMYRFTRINWSKYQERKEFEDRVTAYAYPWATDADGNKIENTFVKPVDVVDTAK